MYCLEENDISNSYIGCMEEMYRKDIVHGIKGAGAIF